MCFSDLTCIPTAAEYSGAWQLQPTTPGFSPEREAQRHEKEHRTCLSGMQSMQQSSLLLGDLHLENEQRCLRDAAFRRVLFSSPSGATIATGSQDLCAG